MTREKRLLEMLKPYFNRDIEMMSNKEVENMVELQYELMWEREKTKGVEND